MTAGGATGALIGRARDIEQVASLLTESRLVTVMGVGGVGKTQLALAVARSRAHAFPAGVYVCELSTLTRDDEVERAVAPTFGASPQRLPQFVAQKLAGRLALLVLDNCEHVLDGARGIVAALVEAAPALTILATSRERLRLAEELAWNLGGLQIVDAEELLLQRVRRHDASFAVTNANRDAVIQICERLEGMPLAIELVAGRLAIMPAASVAARLDDALALLASDEVIPRQRTLRATLDWSYDLLTAEHQRALNRLSLYAGWFEVGPAATVMELDEIAALDAIAALRDRSLLVADTEGDRGRYRLLEPIRQYARERLAGGDDAGQAQRRHCEFVLRESESIGPLLIGVPGGQLVGIDRFRKLLPDLRPAFSWALSHEPGWATRIASATAWAWDIAGELAEGERLLTDCLEAEPDARAATRILSGLALVIDRRGGIALSVSERAVAAGRAGGDRRDLGYALFLLAFDLTYSGRDAEAEAAFDESVAIADEVGDPLLRAWSETIRTLVPLQPAGRQWELRGGEVAIRHARTAHEQGLEVALQWGDVHSASIAAGNLAAICYDLGDLRAARKYQGTCFDLFRRTGNWAVATRLLNFAAVVASASGRYRQAVVLTGAFRRISELAARREVGDHPEVARARAVLGPELSAKLMAEGAALSIDEMFELARAETTVEDSAGLLTPRELEVARLVAAGMASKEIARQLRRSERTVENHVQNALRKLGFRSRSQLGGWLAEQGR